MNINLPRIPITLCTERWFPPSPEVRGRAWSRCRKPLWKASEPSDLLSAESSPNDPLNWPSARRDAVLLAVGLNSLMAGGLIPVLATGLVSISNEFGVSVQTASYTTGLYVIGLGIGAIIWSPTAALYGKRPVYLVGAALLILSSVWQALSTAYISLSVGRFVQGIAASPGEFLVSATIADIYQPHERGFRLGVYMLLVSSGKSLSPLFGAVTIQALNWRWVMWISAIIAAFLLVLLFLFARETFWVRRRGGTNGNAPSPTLDMEEQRAVPASDQGEAYTEKLQRQPELTFTQTLRPWNGTLRNGRWLKLSFAPAYLLAAPTVMWSAGTYAFSMGWLVVMADSAGYIFQDPDGYGFTPMQNGLLYFSPLIGSILGGAAGGKVSDLVACVRAYRNDGLYEPEFRLLMTIPATIATVVGLVSFGWSVELHYHWAVPTVFYGLVFFGCTINAMTAVTYCIDCHKPAANHALVVLNMAKDVHGLIFALFTVDWLAASGARSMFVIIAGIHLAWLLTTVPLYVYGNRVLRRNITRGPGWTY